MPFFLGASATPFAVAGSLPPPDGLAVKIDSEATKICKECGRRKRAEEFSPGRRACKTCRAESERERARALRAELSRPAPEDARWREQTRRRRELLGVSNWYGAKSDEEENPGAIRRIRRRVILRDSRFER
jgi:hypothetical protein